MSDPHDYRLSEAELHRIREQAMDLAGIGLVRFKLDGTILYVDRRFIEIFELHERFPDPAALVGRNKDEFFIPVGSPNWVRDQVQKQSRLRNQEHCFKTLEGKTKWVLHDSYLVDDPQVGEAVIQTAARDITERKLAEQELQRSEAHYRALVQTLPDGIGILDGEGRVIFASQRTVRMLDYEREEEVLGKKFLEFIVPEQWGSAQKRFEAFRAGHSPRDSVYHFVKRDGSLLVGEVEGELVAGPDEKSSRIFVSLRDVTERDRLRAAVRESESLYQALVRTAPNGIATLDLEGHVTYISPLLATILGYDSDRDLVGRHFLELVPEEHQDQARSNVEQAISGGEYLETDAQIRRRDGSTFHGEVHIALAMDAREKPNRLIISIRDVGERKRLLEELASSEAMYRALVNSSPDTISLVDLQGHIRYTSAAQAAKHGYRSADEVVGHHFLEFLPPEIRPLAQAKFEESLRRPVVTGVQLPVRRADGTFYPAELSSALIYDQAGNPQSCIVTIRDITERKRIEDELRDSEQLYRALVEASPEGVCLVDLEGKILFASQRLARMLGLAAPSEMMGRYSGDFVEPQRRELTERKFQELMSSGEGAGFENVFVRADGTTFTVEANASLIKDGHGTPQQAVVVVRDISDLKLTETRLRESEARYRALFESAVEGILVARADTRKFVYANPAICSLLGYTEEELIGMSVNDIHPPESLPEVFAHFEAQVRKDFFDAPGLPCLRKDGTIIWADIHASPAMIDGELSLIGFFTDVTERRRAEVALRETQVRLEAAIESIPFDVFIIGEDGRYTMANSHCRRHWGDLVGKSPEEMATDPEYAEIWRENNRRAFAGEVVTGEVNYLLEGEPLYFFNIISPVMDEGRVREIIGINIDITERRKAEDALAKEKELLAVTLASIGDGVISTDMEGRVMLINEVAAALTGWEATQAVGRPLDEVFVSVTERSGQPVRNLNEEIRRQGPAMGADLVLAARSGLRRIVAASGAPIRDQQHQTVGAVLVFRDVTDKRRTESELFKNQKLESLSLLAGGIAHDFNNILTAILGNISVARMHSGGAEKVDRRLAEAEKACGRARDLTQQLLTFTRSGAPIKSTASLGELIRDSAGFVVRGSNVRIEYDFAPELWPVEVDPGQISQVIHNLILNADQAMPEGGLIRVKAENVEMVSNGGRLSPLLPDGPYARITVSDQGEGIPRENLDKIFDPFFTTKSRGSGLGLAITYSIIKRHEGLIQVFSAPRQGTTFTIHLPASPDQAVPERPEVHIRHAGTGKVLIMDDEGPILEILELMLADLGYQAVLATDGREAVESYRRAFEEGAPFEAVILDLTVPGGMGGKEAVARLREIDPQVKAIVSSGYSTDPVMADFEKYGFSGVVAKPYDLDGLSQALQLTLGED